jgi:hypothetical protein
MCVENNIKRIFLGGGGEECENCGRIIQTWEESYELIWVHPIDGARTGDMVCKDCADSSCVWVKGQNLD